MSDSDGYFDEMRRFSDIADHNSERLLTGKAPADKQLEDLAAFLGEVRRISFLTPSHAVEQQHLAKIVATSQLFVEKGEPDGRPASKAIGPESQVSGLPKRRSRFVLNSLLTSLIAKIVASGMALAAVTTGGLATTGNLPPEVQTAISSAVEKLGIEIPSGEVSAGADAKLEADDDVDADVGAGVDAEVEGPDTGEGGGAEEGAGDSQAGGMSTFVHEIKETTDPGERGRVICAEASGGECVHEVDGEEGLEETPNEGPGNSGNTPASEHRNSGDGNGNGDESGDDGVPTS